MKTENKAATAEEFDARVDAGEDVFAVAEIDIIRRTTIDFPESMLKRLDAQAQKRGVTRQSLIKMWLFERLERIELNMENVSSADLRGIDPNEYAVIPLRDLRNLRKASAHSAKPRKPGTRVLRDRTKGTFVTRKSDVAVRGRRSNKSAGKAEKAP